MLQKGNAVSQQPCARADEETSVGASTSHASNQQSDIMPDMAKLSMEEGSSGHESTHHRTTQPPSSDMQQLLGSSATSLLIDKLFSDTSSDSDAAQPKDVDCTEGWEYRRTAKVGGVWVTYQMRSLVPGKALPQIDPKE